MKKGLILLSIGAILLGSVMVVSASSSVFTTNTGTKATKKATEEKDLGIITVEAHSDIVRFYPDIRSLTKDSDIVIEGDVMNASTKYYKDRVAPSTLSQVKVSRVISGDVKIGDVLTFQETGGITTQRYISESSGRGKDFPPLSEAEENKQVDFKIDGISAMKKGEKVMLFGGRYQEGIYLIVGGYQGKFKVDDEQIERPAPKGDEAVYPALKMSLSSLESEVKSFKK
ncbi:hypothetical protein J2Z48_001992 [Croceifilum oryzae]|uniref:Uncharacterized protein n=1 Tax=Croceifilum oryzae TaxID=1553429 RepID=A0AAJ1WT97_9BACL|nr:hypothetical protein [Croceifilum oryzae]MDQ0417808.1 hypothetical protein [Croceifilum oryzae]